MSHMQLWQIDSTEQLRKLAPAWDRLWQRSDVSLPTARAELVAQWADHFAPRSTLRLTVVEKDGELLAAVPLKGRTIRRIVPVGDLTINYWSPNGELLLDPKSDAEAVLSVLADGLEEAPWPLLWLDLVPFETGRWQSLIQTLRARGLAADVHFRYRIGLVEVRGDFDEYFAGLSKAHRQTVGKKLRRLKRDGSVQLRVYYELSPDEVDGRLRRAFEIEQASWKHQDGHTVLDTPGMFEFYRRQARQLAECGHLRLAFLEHRGKPIAFEHGWTAKGVYYSFKVGYDASYRRFSPGHLLRMLLIRDLFERREVERIDFQGPLTEALAQWSTGSYAIGRLVIAPRRLPSRLLMAGYRSLGPLVRRLRFMTRKTANGDGLDGGLRERVGSAAE